MLRIIALALALMTTSAASLAQTLKVLHTFVPNGAPFTNADGGRLNTGVILSGGTLYGTASSYGLNGNGTVFSVDTTGSNFTVLHEFTETPGSLHSSNFDGAVPSSGLAISGRTLFGMTEYGGTNGFGTIFSVDIHGSNFTVLHAFGNVPGGLPPVSQLVVSGSTIYGTEESSGTDDGGTGAGTVFSLSTNGSNFTVLHLFTNTPDGGDPQSGVVISGASLYGTTVGGGTSNSGAIFAMGADGNNYRVLHSFTKSPDGAAPAGGLVLVNGTLYGTTSSGGLDGNGTIFAISTNGGPCTVLHSFSALSVSNSELINLDGANPLRALTWSGSLFYGTASSGGTNGAGTIFSITPDGSNFTTLFNMNNDTTGSHPQSTLALASNALYGTAESGPIGNAGSVFVLQLPISPVLSIGLDPGGLASIKLNGEPNTSYRLQVSPNLAPRSAWRDIFTNSTDVGGAWQLSDTNSSYIPFQFYRAVTP